MEASIELQNNHYEQGYENLDISIIEEDYWKLCFTPDSKSHINIR